MDEMHLPKGTIVITVPSVEKGHELADAFRCGGAKWAVVGMTEDGEIVVAIAHEEFCSLEGLTAGITKDRITRGQA